MLMPGITAQGVASDTFQTSGIVIRPTPFWTRCLLLNIKRGTAKWHKTQASQTMTWVELHKILDFELVFNRNFILASTTQLCWAYEGQSLQRVSVPTWHISGLKFYSGHPFWQRSVLDVNQSICLSGTYRVQILSYKNIASKVPQQHSFHSWTLKALSWLSQISVS